MNNINSHFILICSNSHRYVYIKKQTNEHPALCVPIIAGRATNKELQLIIIIKDEVSYEPSKNS